MPSLPEIEQALRQRLDALGPAPRAELLHYLMPPDLERAERIGYWAYPKTCTFAELLIDCEERPDAPGGASGDAPGARLRFVSVAGRLARAAR